MTKKQLNSGGAYSVLRDEYRLRKKKNKGLRKQAREEGLYEVGIFLTELPEKLPIFNAAPIEKVLARIKDPRGHAGARIVLTKDNFGHRGTGLGGIGGTKCEAIDIVAGSLSCEERNLNDVETRANFISDGARIYLTERGDINHYFCLGASNKATGISSKLKSGIGIKADHTLVIGRERVRILVGLSNAEGGERLVNMNKNVNAKIELGIINTPLQPAVLGNNLVNYLRIIEERIFTLEKKLLQKENADLQMKSALALHTHNGFGIGVIQTLPAINVAQEVVQTLPEFFRTTFRAIRDAINMEGTSARALGLPSRKIRGTPDTGILSSTVYIG